MLINSSSRETNRSSVSGAAGLGPIVQTSSEFARKRRSTTIYLASRAPGKSRNLKQDQGLALCSGRTTQEIVNTFSAVYIVNGVRDIDRDRRHAKKRHTRPLASGAASVPAALTLLALLYGVLVLGWFVQPAAVAVICGYVALNLTYSF